MKLISMTDYVLMTCEDCTKTVGGYNGITLIIDCHNYAMFLKTPLTLEMFVPCDEDGNVMEMPLGYMKFKQVGGYGKNGTQFMEYQQAEERVIFEGFEVAKNFENRMVLKRVASPQVHAYLDGITFTMNYPRLFGQEIIENLIEVDLTLTPVKAKELGL